MWWYSNATSGVKVVQVWDVTRSYTRPKKVTATSTVLSRSSPMRLFFLFSNLKKFLSDHRYKSRQAIGSAMIRCPRGRPKSAYSKAFQKWIQRLILLVHISNLGEHFWSTVKLIWMLLRYRTIHTAYRTTGVYTCMSFSDKLNFHKKPLKRIHSQI